MDITLLLKFVHVTAAILWIGGGFTLLLTGMLRLGRASADELLGLIRTVAFLGPRLFMPVSLITLASGVALLFLAGWGWQAFTVLGLAGVVFTALFGSLILGPSAERAVALAEKQGAAAAMPALRGIFRLAKLDYAVQFGIIFLMVVKPGWSEIALLAGLGAVIVLAAFATLRPLGQPA
jgi:uncharacterized membrane protein